MTGTSAPCDRQQPISELLQDRIRDPLLAVAQIVTVCEHHRIRHDQFESPRRQFFGHEATRHQADAHASACCADERRVLLESRPGLRRHEISDPELPRRFEPRVRRSLVLQQGGAGQARAQRAARQLGRTNHDELAPGDVFALHTGPVACSVTDRGVDLARVRLASLEMPVKVQGNAGVQEAQRREPRHEPLRRKAES